MRQYVIDAFTDHVFAGNPAAVCVMDRWLDEAKMMAITIENNLSETAFAVREGEKYHLRWFTPGGEIDLCGHATLGTACAIMTFVEPERTQITFSTLSGDLTVVRRGDRYEMDFPAYALRPVPVTEEMVAAMNGARPRPALSTSPGKTAWSGPAASSAAARSAPASPTAGRTPRCARSRSAASSACRRPSSTTPTPSVMRRSATAARSTPRSACSPVRSPRAVCPRTAAAATRSTPSKARSVAPTTLPATPC